MASAEHPDSGHGRPVGSAVVDSPGGPGECPRWFKVLLGVLVLFWLFEVVASPLQMGWLREVSQGAQRVYVSIQLALVTCVLSGWSWGGFPGGRQVLARGRAMRGATALLSLVVSFIAGQTFAQSEATIRGDWHWDDQWWIFGAGVLGGLLGAVMGAVSRRSMDAHKKPKQAAV